MSPFRLWVDPSMKAMLIVIANEPLWHSEAVGDNPPLLRVVSFEHEDVAPSSLRPNPGLVRSPDSS